MFTKSIALNKEIHKIFHCLFSIDFLPAASASGGPLGKACPEIKLVSPAVLSLDDKRSVQRNTLAKAGIAIPTRAIVSHQLLPEGHPCIHLAAPHGPSLIAFLLPRLRQTARRGAGGSSPSCPWTRPSS